MATTTTPTENSRQGINFQIPHCIGPDPWLSRNLRWVYGHAYAETPVGLIVYVRNDPVNLVDPDGHIAIPGIIVIGGGVIGKIGDVPHVNPFPNVMTFEFRMGELRNIY